MIHVPLLRGGEPYRGLNKTPFRIAQTFDLPLEKIFEPDIEH